MYETRCPSGERHRSDTLWRAPNAAGGSNDLTSCANSDGAAHCTATTVSSLNTWGSPLFGPLRKAAVIAGALDLSSRAFQAGSIRKARDQMFHRVEKRVVI